MADKKPLAVVTGASSGIGKALAKQFAKHGYDLLVTAESGRLEGAIPELEALGARVQAVHADLATYDGVEALVEAVRAAGPVDALALNAGVGVGGDFIRDTDLQAELNLIRLNVDATVHLAKRLVGDMVARGAGRVLFTSSVASQMPGPFEAVYAASKAFVQSFALALRNEIRDTGVTVTSLMPGPTETDFFRRADLLDTKVGAQEKDDPEDVARQGYEALMAGKDHVVGGSLMNKAQVIATGFMPETATAEMHRKLAEPGSAEK